MLPDRVSNPGPLIYESGALPIALRGPMGQNRLDQIEDTEVDTNFPGNLNRVKDKLNQILFAKRGT